MNTIGLAVITLNESSGIKRCLESASFCQQLVVVDSGSTDGTQEIAKKCRAQVIHREWSGYSKQKQFAMDQINCDWVLVLDGDEYLTPELASEIQEIAKSEAKFDAYELQRNFIFMDRVFHYGKGVDHVLRFLKRGVGKYDGNVIHESIIVDGPIGRMKNMMLHDSSPTINDRMKTVDRDTNLELENTDPPYKTSAYHLFVVPWLFFFNNLIKRRAYKDGMPGLIFLVITTFQVFLQHAKFYEANINYKKANS